MNGMKLEKEHVRLFLDTKFKDEEKAGQNEAELKEFQDVGKIDTANFSQVTILYKAFSKISRGGE